VNTYICIYPINDFQAGFLAQRRLARGLRLNQTEAIALIATQLQERIRDGTHSVAQLMGHGKHILGRKHVLSSVPSQIHQIQVEGTFHDGSVLLVFFVVILLIYDRVFLVTVHDPICTEDGDIEAALYGSFLPIPPDSAFHRTTLPNTLPRNNQAPSSSTNQTSTTEESPSTKEGSASKSE
jgi:urease